MTWDCAQRGHHWHEPDGEPNGAVYVRHKGRDRATRISVMCCHCGTESAGTTLWGKMAPPPADELLAATHECGDALQPKPATKAAPKATKTKAKLKAKT